MSSNRFNEARRVSLMTQAQAAKAAGLAGSTYPLRERDPGNFRLKELKGLYSSMTKTGRTILKKAVDDFFCNEI